MEYYAKSKNPQGHQETVKEHLQKVTALAQAYGKLLGLEKITELAGHVHDFGKYPRTYQDVLTGARTGIDHAIGGACFLEYCYRGKPESRPVIEAVNGHHDGLTAYNTIKAELHAVADDHKQAHGNAGKTPSIETAAQLNEAIAAFRNDFPDFKLPKEILDRRLSVMESEGIVFKTGVLVGSKKDIADGVFCNAKETVSAEELKKNYAAVVLCPGSEVPRDLKIDGRGLKGIHYALEFLIAQNLEIQGAGENRIDVAGKNVVVIGGGETASDCIGTAIRKGARSVTQLDYHDELPESVDVFKSWPYWRNIKRTSPSQEEGCVRLFSTNTTSFVGKNGKLTGITTQKVKWGQGRHFDGIPGTEGAMDCDVALIAMGYSHPSSSLAAEFGLETDERGNIKADYEGDNAFKTSCDKVFAAGDGRRGQSLVVWALAEGRRCAEAVDQYLMQIPHA